MGACHSAATRSRASARLTQTGPAAVSTCQMSEETPPVSGSAAGLSSSSTSPARRSVATISCGTREASAGPERRAGLGSTRANGRVLRGDDAAAAVYLSGAPGYGEPSATRDRRTAEARDRCVLELATAVRLACRERRRQRGEVAEEGRARTPRHVPKLVRGRSVVVQLPLAGRVLDVGVPECPHAPPARDPDARDLVEGVGLPPGA